MPGKEKRMHIVTTWGSPRAVTEYLESHMYEGVRHFLGKFYFCTKFGHNLEDVAIVI